MPRRKYPKEFDEKLLKPNDPKNPTPGKWLVPSPEKLLLLLRRANGAVDVMLNALGHEDDHEEMLFVILERLAGKDASARFCKPEWDKLISIHEEAQLAILKARYLTDTVGEMEPAKRKTDFGRRTKSWGDVRKLFPARRETVDKAGMDPDLAASLNGILEALK